MSCTAGEQPIKGLVSPAAQARMTACEALSNLVFADITALGDVKASCNWMWPAKLWEIQVLYLTVRVCNDLCSKGQTREHVDTILPNEIN